MQIVDKKRQNSICRAALCTYTSPYRNSPAYDCYRLVCIRQRPRYSAKFSYIVLKVHYAKLHARSNIELIYQFKDELLILEQPASSSAHRPLRVPTGGLASQQRCAACNPCLQHQLQTPSRLPVCAEVMHDITTLVAGHATVQQPRS